MRSHDRTQRCDALATAFTISALVCANFESPSQALDKILLASIEIGNQSGTLIGLKLYT